MFSIYSGITEVKSITMSSNIFVSGGSLTLGQVAPGLVVDLAVGDFKGYIDEVRLWSRPHNPTIIANNFRIVITDDTSDVSHSWNFNEGFGLTAREKKKGDNMIVVSVSDAPVWVTSDLILSLESDLDLPKLTTEDGILASVITTAQTTCNSLLTNFTTIISSSDSSNLADYTSLCISELTLTGDISQAAVILASAADEYMAAENTTVNPLEELCSSLESIDSYCSACEFGTMIGGALVAEIVFSYPGLGTTMLQAITMLDYPLLSATTLIITLMVLFVTLLIDIIYGFIDPRVKAEQFDS